MREGSWEPRRRASCHEKGSCRLSRDTASPRRHLREELRSIAVLTSLPASLSAWAPHWPNSRGRFLYTGPYRSRGQAGERWMWVWEEKGQQESSTVHLSASSLVLHPSKKLTSPEQGTNKSPSPPMFHKVMLV